MALILLFPGVTRTSVYGSIVKAVSLSKTIRHKNDSFWTLSGLLDHLTSIGNSSCNQRDLTAELKCLLLPLYWSDRIFELVLCRTNEPKRREHPKGYIFFLLGTLTSITYHILFQQETGVLLSPSALKGRLKSPRKEELV